MTDTQKFWIDEGGDAYHKRNRVEWWKRKPVWDGLINMTAARSVFEFGTGPGWNLSAIKAVHAEVGCWGCDINANAVREAQAAKLDVHAGSLIQMGYTIPTFDLTYTVGCLIHIAPRYLEEIMRRMILMSNRYVLSIEYESDIEVEINYRGQDGLLWKRPYGEMYRALGLKFVSGGTVGPADGFDHCTWWLGEK